MGSIFVSIVERKFILRCPHCQSERTIKSGGKLKNGNTRYRCKDCKRTFNADTVIHNMEGITCLHCGSSEVRPKGHTPDGRRRYKCLACGRRSTENPDVKHAKARLPLNPDERKIITIYSHCRVKPKQIAEYLDKPVTTIYAFRKHHRLVVHG